MPIGLRLSRESLYPRLWNHLIFEVNKRKWYVKECDVFDDFTVETVAGALKVTLLGGLTPMLPHKRGLQDPASRSFSGIWIAARFLEPEKACDHWGIPRNQVYTHTRLNGYSGKWNWMVHEFSVCKHQQVYPSTMKEHHDGGVRMIIAFCDAVDKLRRPYVPSEVG